MSALNRIWAWFKGVLNRSPLITTIVSGLLVYLIAVGLSVLAVIVADYGWLYSFACLLGASLVLAYHWIMSRYQTTSWLAQLVHMSAALFFMWIALAMPIRYSLLMD